MNKILNNLKKGWRDHSATLIGILVAISTAWLTIDWTTFDIHKEWPKLVLSAIIATGGIITKIKGKDASN